MSLEPSRHQNREVLISSPVLLRPFLDLHLAKHPEDFALSLDRLKRTPKQRHQSKHHRANWFQTGLSQIWPSLQKDGLERTC